MGLKTAIKIRRIDGGLAAGAVQGGGCIREEGSKGEKRRPCKRRRSVRSPCWPNTPTSSVCQAAALSAPHPHPPLKTRNWNARLFVNHFLAHCTVHSSRLAIGCRSAREGANVRQLWPASAGIIAKFCNAGKEGRPQMEEPKMRYVDREGQAGRKGSGSSFAAASAQPNK